ncbi:MAG: hypothetical protein WCE62_06730 [Polyangiales bacterium]
MQGFDEFYGLLRGETKQWSPAVYHNQNRVEAPDDPDYPFMNDMATQAIHWMRFQQSLTPDKPFFVYIVGDNGSSAEGGMNALYKELTHFNSETKGSDVDFMLEHYDDWGGPTRYPHMAAGWAVAFDSPFVWTKLASIATRSSRTRLCRTASRP